MISIIKKIMLWVVRILLAIMVVGLFVLPLLDGSSNPSVVVEAGKTDTFTGKTAIVFIVIGTMAFFIILLGVSGWKKLLSLIPLTGVLYLLLSPSIYEAGLGEISTVSGGRESGSFKKQSPAEEAEAKRSKPNAGEFRVVKRKFVDLTGCEEVEEFPLKPEFGKPIEKILDPGDYAITTDGSTNQWSSDGKIRGFWSDGVIMDLEGNNVWILEAGPDLPVQDAPYGTVTMKIGRKGATMAIGLGTKLHLKKTTSIYMGSNIFPGMEFYRNSSWRIQVHTWKCPKMADN